ncbi:MAG: hypothetical protein IKP88_08635 [Lachnospiraceae bacterium]|nr:hypothetical protein [Lachnospiraceae bacterium]
MTVDRDSNRRKRKVDTMNNIIKCVLVTIISVFCYASVSTFADENIKKGDLLLFGTYEQDNNLKNGAEPIEWIVLDVDENKGKALLFSKYVLDCRLFNEVEESCNVTWEYCTLRKWLNKDFYNIAFTDKEKESIALTKNKNPKTSGFTIDGNDTKDRVFLLTLYDLLNEDYGFSKFYSIEDENRRCAATPYAVSLGLFTLKYQKTKDGLDTCGYWLRSSGDSLQDVVTVNADGSIEIRGQYANNNELPLIYSRNGVIEDSDAFKRYNFVGVRPALWVNLADGFDILKHEKPTQPIISATQKNDQIILSIDEAYNADGYIVYAKVPGKKKYKKIKTITEKGEKHYTCIIKKIKKGTYSFKVKAYRYVNGTKILSDYSKAKKISISEKTFADSYKSVKEGDTITFGSYDQNFNLSDDPEPIEWKVLSVDDTGILLLSKYALDTKEYQESGMVDSRKFTEWEECSLHTWLNEIFYYKAFNCDERALIKESIVDNYGQISKDKVFLLSYDDITNSKYGFLDKLSEENKGRVCVPTQSVIENSILFSNSNIKEYTCRWHILNPYGHVSDAHYIDTFVEFNGVVNVAICHLGDNEYCVRPVIKLGLD